MLAYQNSMFGKVVVGDNSALLLNAIDELSGSADLISIRSRGNFQRPFSLINEIEEKAELETAEEVEKINAEIQLFEEQLQQLLSAKTGQEQQILGSNIVQQTRELEVKKVKARQQLRDVKMKKRETIEKIGNKLRSFNMLMAPAIILIVAILLTMRRSLMKRHYISHASDS